ncbi:MULTISPECIES: peptidoglycan DD-metalloendopeptidase family protein [unclassified Luteococcus]|uniref:peptidoglycan DD-metalloendopeptidase family protein n=1 Tax=unclassified Luteococcus TaxID=2639923 RepID=UPI00313D7C2C
MDTAASVEEFTDGRCSRARARASARLALVAVTAVGLTLALAPPAGAEDLDDERDRINTRMAQSQSDLAEFSAELNQAAETLATSQAELATARKALAAAVAARDAAQAEDARQAKALDAARAKLAKAQKDVVDNHRRVLAEARLIGASVRETHQQNTELLGIAAFVTEVNSTADVNSTMQWSTTIFNATQAQMDRLKALQVKLDVAKRAQTEAEKQVAEARAKAASQLTASKAAAAQASQAKASVDQLVSAHQQARTAAADKVAAEKQRQQALAAESSAVQQRIETRIAAQKAAAAKAAQAAAAQLEAEAQRKAEGAKKAETAAKAAASKHTGADRTPLSAAPPQTAPAASAGGGFGAPVQGPVTSPFGQRFHPVLHIWKLHDGMDYGAACGTTMVAPADGVVTEAYYNAGYGNRLIVDHGSVDGHYVTTAYNHATHYVVGVGQKVTKGQVLGHVGTTGYSTGCHLHLMVWRDGQLVNPNTYF